MFQYQKGAIKTVRQHFADAHFRARFNTKKVRLKLHFVSNERTPTPCFNTKKVRLKVTFTARRRPSRYRFNTKKVRLKRVLRFDKRHRRCKFQYQKGAIKTRCRLATETTTKTSFNTKKVRLKPVRKPPEMCICLSMFQYQKGAIKTAGSKRAKSGFLTVSIPKRCD